MAVNSADQVARLLALVPYLQAHPDAEVGETARVFGVTPKQLIADLRVAWFCGLPGGLPGDLIEVDMDVVESQGRIRLSNADFLARPLRFSPDEATSLVVALRLLAQVADPVAAPVVASALAKLEDAVGQTPEIGIRLASGEEQTRAELARALAQGKSVRLTYHGASSQVVTTPLIDPARLAVRDGVAYLDAWSYDRNDWRTYRIDRIANVDVTAQSVSDHGPAPTFSGGWLDARPDAVEVTLGLAREAKWVTEYFPMVEVAQRLDGTIQAKLLVADPVWFRRLLLRLGASVLTVHPPEAATSAGIVARKALDQSRVG